MIHEFLGVHLNSVYDFISLETNFKYQQIIVKGVRLFQMCDVSPKFEMFAIVVSLASTFHALTVYKFHTASTL